jgi:hypothetical protein
MGDFIGRPVNSATSSIPTLYMTGPDEAMLGRLAKALPSMAEGYIKDKIGGKGQSVLRYPRYSCAACLTVWGKPYQQGPPVTAVCKECNKVLRKGGTILISLDNRMVKVLPKERPVNPDYAGRIVRISIEAMTQLHGLLPPAEPPAGESPPTPPQSPETDSPPPA